MSVKTLVRVLILVAFLAATALIHPLCLSCYWFLRSRWVWSGGRAYYATIS